MSSDRQEGHVGFLPIALNFFPQVLQIYVANQLVSIVTTGPPPEHMILSPISQRRSKSISITPFLDRKTFRRFEKIAPTKKSSRDASCKASMISTNRNI
jgi:hypothetical protein